MNNNILPQDPIASLEQWTYSGIHGALAVVVKAYGSSPRPLGAMMAVSETGQMVGSVSGGCVEGAVWQEAQTVLMEGRPRLVSYGISDDWAAEAGLTCGGNIDVYIMPWRSDPVWSELRSARLNKTPAALALGISGRLTGALGLFYEDGRGVGALAGREQPLRAMLKTTFAEQRPRAGVVLPDGSSAAIVIPFFPPQRLIIVGAVHIAISLVRFAAELGYETIVVDPRPTFASSQRFSHADHLHITWPQEAFPNLKPDAGTSIAVVSHDDKLDIPALVLALESNARYIGALGSRKTMARRAAALRDAGFTDDQIARIHNPIGLDLGGRSPEEIALSIIAEIVAVRYGKKAF